MTIHESARKPLRLWPGIVLVAVQIISFVVVPSLTPDAELPYGLMGGVLASLLIWVWWLLFSRAPWLERLGAMVLLVIAILGSKPLVDQSIAGAGQGFLIYGLGIVPTAMALVAWAALTRNLHGGLRWVTLAAAIVIGIMPFHLVRTPGVGGGSGFALHWRWTPTPEDLLLARGPEELKPLPPVPDTVAAPAKAAVAAPEKPVAVAPPIEKVEKVEAAARLIEDGPAEWPGFRGPNRDSVVRGVRINTDWSAAPPVQVWRRPIGPGWSSFSVRGDLLYTQEQRGNEEVVSAYRVSTGEPVWRHADPVRFYESNGGAGPRGTPTIHKDRVYSMGATGVLNALDARTGKKMWSVNTSSDTKREVPYWGISSSPLVVDDVVIVSVGGPLAGYDVATGEQRWSGKGGSSYSSPHLVTIDGVTQVLNLSGPGVVSVNPADGTLLWDYKWEGGAIIQPGVTEDGDVLINAMSATGGMGTRRIAIKHEGGAWTPEERWTSNGLKPYFNDYVIHKGHAYGFDNNILACIDLADGKRKWKGGRFGNGQLVLLADQDLLVVISEEGELALVSATTDQFKEMGRFPALDAKTWNHPVIVGNVLLVRNGEEMAAFRLATEGSRTSNER